MLEIARTKFQPDEAIDFQQADATALPFAGASFDMVVCQFGVMFFPDKDKSYREVFRVPARRPRVNAGSPASQAATPSCA